MTLIAPIAPAPVRADRIGAVSAGSTAGRRIDAVDGLRALAVAGVIAFHFGFGPTGGFLGVDLFFVVSGFVITRALIREQETSGRTSLSGFWKRRFRRIFPSLALILLTVAVWSWSADVSASFRHAASEGTLAALVSAGNWWQILGPTGYWALGSERDPLTHLWSLGVEEQFYLVFPLLFILLVRFIAPAWRWRVAVAATCCAYLWTATLALTTAPTGPDIDRIYLGTDTRCGALLGGCALALFLARRAQCAYASRQEARRSTRRASVAAIAAAAVLGALWAVSSVGNPSFFTIELPLAGLAAVALIGGVVQAPAAPLARALAWRPLATVGRWSYALYLWHWVVWVFIQQTPLQGTVLATLIAIVATVILSVASHYLVEQPVLRRSWSWPTITGVVIGVSVLLGAGAVWTLATVPLPESGTGDVIVSTH